MTTLTLEQIAFAAIMRSEVSGSAQTADKITSPLLNPKQDGTGGWTIGWDQEDFAHGTNAETTLEDALTAGPNPAFTLTQATDIANALVAAKTSSNITSILATLPFQTNEQAINAALSSSAGAASKGKMGSEWIFQAKSDGISRTMTEARNGAAGALFSDRTAAAHYPARQ